MLSSAYLHNEPLLFCFAGPTASGKSSICRKLVERDPNLRLSVSTTTRLPREGEKEAIDYYFVKKAEFRKRVEAGKFIEHAQFGDNLYGTERTQFEDGEALSDVLLDIEVQGVRQVKKIFPQRTVVVFVLPPSLAVLEQRLRERKTEDEASIQRRLEIARVEVDALKNPDLSDYLLVNDDLDFAVDEAMNIIHAERRSLERIDPRIIGSFFE
jgi:guanylate kinase